MLNYSIESNFSRVRELTKVLHGFCSEHKLSKELAGQLELMLVEAVNNVIEHAYQSKQGMPIDICFEVNASEVIMTISDSGIAMPHTIPEASEPISDINKLPEGGWGVALIHNLADHVKNYREDGVNIMIISKKI